MRKAKTPSDTIEKLKEIQKIFDKNSAEYSALSSALYQMKKEVPKDVLHEHVDDSSVGYYLDSYSCPRCGHDFSKDELNDIYRCPNCGQVLEYYEDE